MVSGDKVWRKGSKHSRGPGRGEEGTRMQGSFLGGEGLVQAGCFQGQKLNGQRQQEGEHRCETQERVASSLEADCDLEPKRLT